MSLWPNQEFKVQKLTEGHRSWKEHAREQMNTQKHAEVNWSMLEHAEVCRFVQDVAELKQQSLKWSESMTLMVE